MILLQKNHSSALIRLSHFIVCFSTGSISAELTHTQCRAQRHFREARTKATESSKWKLNAHDVLSQHSRYTVRSTCVHNNEIKRKECRKVESAARLSVQETGKRGSIKS